MKMESTSAAISQMLIPTFDGENYEFWKIKMRTLLLSQNLWSFIESGYTEPENEVALTDSEKKKLDDSRMKDSKALLFIQQGVSATIFPRICGATKAKEAWEILQKEFQGNTKVMRIKLQSLRREFENLKMKEAETMQDYFSRMMEVVNQLRTYGEDVTE